MTDEIPSELSLALCDLRSAYRLVYAYHRRTNEIAGQVAKAMDGAGLAFSVWDPVFFSRPSGRRRAFWSDHWAWDLMPGYGMGLLFESERRVGGLHRRVLVQFIADDGFEKRGGEPDPAAFTAVSEARSVLRYSILRSPTKIPEYGGVQPYLDAAGEQVCNGDEHHIVGDGYDFAYRWCEFDLAKLPTTRSVQERLVAVLVEQLRAAYPSTEKSMSPAATPELEG